MSLQLPLRELRRRPSRFVVATVVLSFLATLLLFLGGLLDGLYLGSTGAIRAQQGDVIVYSATARDSFLRSRIGPETRDQIAELPEVEEVGGLGFVLLAATVPDQDESADVAIAGYEIAPRGVPDVSELADGEGVADSRLRDDGVREGSTLMVGPQQTPVTVVGFVDDTAYLQQGTIWVNLPTWRMVQNDNRPDAAVGDDVSQVLVVTGTGDGDNADLATAIESTTDGATTALTVDEAVNALPGVEQQRSTFNQIITVTLVVVLAVVGLFFSLLTLERIGLYGVLKAIGASSWRLFIGVLVQALVVATVAFVIGSLLVLLATLALPSGVPLQLLPSRFVFTFVALLVAAALGSAISLRRVLRVDPAAAIGTTA